MAHLFSENTELFECVPNISEGRDKKKITNLEEQLLSIKEIRLLHVNADNDANRSVFTFIGSYNGILEAAIEIMDFCKKHIPLTHHIGAHPRIGSLDVFPIVPLNKTKKERALSLSIKVAKKIGTTFKTPCYLYRESAREEYKYLLKNCRKGFFEGLPKKILDKNWEPDFGEKKIFPTGISVIGCRFFLIAYNITLNTSSVEVVKKIASTIRNMNTTKKKPFVTAIGWCLKERNVCQVSLNLNDYRVFNIDEAFSGVSEEAKKHGCSPIHSEIIGMIPRDAVEKATKKTSMTEIALFRYLKMEKPENILKEQVLLYSCSAL